MKRLFTSICLLLLLTQSAQTSNPSSGIGLFFKSFFFDIHTPPQAGETTGKTHKACFPLVDLTNNLSSAWNYMRGTPKLTIVMDLARDVYKKPLERASGLLMLTGQSHEALALIQTGVSKLLNIRQYFTVGQSAYRDLRTHKTLSNETLTSILFLTTTALIPSVVSATTPEPNCNDLRQPLRDELLSSCSFDIDQPSCSDTTLDEFHHCFNRSLSLANFTTDYNLLTSHPLIPPTVTTLHYDNSSSFCLYVPFDDARKLAIAFCRNMGTNTGHIGLGPAPNHVEFVTFSHPGNRVGHFTLTNNGYACRANIEGMSATALPNETNVRYIYYTGGSGPIRQLAIDALQPELHAVTLANPTMAHWFRHHNRVIGEAPHQGPRLAFLDPKNHPVKRVTNDQPYLCELPAGPFLQMCDKMTAEAYGSSDPNVPGDTCKLVAICRELDGKVIENIVYYQSKSLLTFTTNNGHLVLVDSIDFEHPISLMSNTACRLMNTITHTGCTWEISDLFTTDPAMGDTKLCAIKTRCTLPNNRGVVTEDVRIFASQLARRYQLEYNNCDGHLVISDYTVQDVCDHPERAPMHRVGPSRVVYNSFYENYDEL